MLGHGTFTDYNMSNVTFYFAFFSALNKISLGLDCLTNKKHDQLIEKTDYDTYTDTYYCISSN